MALVAAVRHSLAGVADHFQLRLHSLPSGLANREILHVRDGALLFFPRNFFLGNLKAPSPFSYLDKSGMGLFLQNSNTAQAMGVCAEAIIMAMAVISKTRWLQQELNQKIQAQRELVENQNRLLESTVAQRTHELVESKAELEKQHEVVVDSIRYASRLQRTQPPRLQRIKNIFLRFMPSGSHATPSVATSGGHRCQIMKVASSSLSPTALATACRVPCSPC